MKNMQKTFVLTPKQADKVYGALQRSIKKHGTSLALDDEQDLATLLHIIGKTVDWLAGVSGPVTKEDVLSKK